MALIHQVIPVGPFQCNCHVLADDATRTAVVIDPGDEPAAILAVVKDLGVKVTHLLHTHCHLDHIRGTRRLKEETGARILLHPADKDLYEGLKDQCSEVLHLFGLRMPPSDDPLPVDDVLVDGQAVPLGASAFKVIHTPGHTPGSCCFELETPARRLLFSGDTLFAGSIGRTDLRGGNHEQELDSIRTRLFPMDADTVVLPGHGPDTRIGEERDANPFFQ